MDAIALISLTLFILVGVAVYRIVSLTRTNRTLSKQLSESSDELKGFRTRFSDVFNAEDAVEEAKQSKHRLEEKIEELRSVYAHKKQIFDRLVSTAAIYDESIELAELGFYKPHFDFDTSEEFKETIAGVLAEQKAMVRGKTAITCTTQWTVDGDKTKGKVMTDKGIRLVARAFNNECEAAIANTRWNNAERMLQRIQKAFDAINKLSETNAISISPQYLELKLKELRLTHEYREKRQQEKEEQAEIRRQMREEAQLQKELDDTLKEEARQERLLAKAKEAAAKAVGDQLAKLNAKIAQLDEELQQAHAKAERAKSMAEQTRSGHVYVISNVGSFGEHVYKIGMTRRLEPLDRVRELGDASVPFLFDVHAMIYSDDAPALEKSLHRIFESARVNMVNNRREFFQVPLTQIKEEVRKLMPKAQFVETIEAKEYRESQAIRDQLARRQAEQDVRAEFPEMI